MAATIAPDRPAAAARWWPDRGPGLGIVALGLVLATLIDRAVNGVPMIVAAVLVGVVFGNSRMVGERADPGLAFSSRTLLRGGIVMLGLRLSIGEVVGLGFTTLLLIVVTVVSTFFGVQAVGRRLGLSEGLSVLVASGFSICGNSAIASVKGAADVEDEDVAAAVGLVTLCGTLAIVVVPMLGALFELSDGQLGVWTGASVQDTAQVIAVASAAGPSVLAIATAVKLTRVLFLAPIVVGVSAHRCRRSGSTSATARPAALPLFVLGFVAAIVLRSSNVLSDDVLDIGRHVEQWLLAAGMVGLGAAVRLSALRRLGVRPLLLGAVAWLMVGSISLACIMVLGIG